MNAFLRLMCLSLCAILLASCEEFEQKGKSLTEWEIVDSSGTPNGGATIYAKKLIYEGHVYIMFDGWRRMGVVHSPECPCNKAK